MYEAYPFFEKVEQIVLADAASNGPTIFYFNKNARRLMTLAVDSKAGSSRQSSSRATQRATHHINMYSM